MTEFCQTTFFNTCLVFASYNEVIYFCFYFFGLLWWCLQIFFKLKLFFVLKPEQWSLSHFFFKLTTVLVLEKTNSTWKKFEGTTKVNLTKSSTTKGQIISECLFDFLNFPKNHRKIWQISAQKSKKCSNHKITAPYSVFNTLNSPYNHRIIRKCLYFVDLTTF